MAESRIHIYVQLVQDQDGYPPFEAEEIDAVALGSDEFKVASAPAFAYGLAPGDVVRTTQDADGRLWVVEVVASSTEWVARVIPRKGCDPATVVELLERLGATCAITRFGLVTLSVPGTVNSRPVLDAIEAGQEVDGLWHFDLGVAPTS